MATALVALATTTLASASATITFSSISGAYRDLLLEVTYQPSAASNQMTLKLNGDSTASYVQAIMAGNGSTTQGGGTTGTDFSPVIMAAVPATNWVVYTANIMDYAQTDKQKAVTIRSSHAGEVGALGGRWTNTAAVTSITLTGAPNLNAGTIATLYGVTA